MKNHRNLNPERLEKLAKWLSGLKIGLRVELLEDSANSFKSEDSINVIPVFITPIKSLPKIFKDDWKHSSNGEISWKDDTDETTLTSLQKFFGIDCEMVMHLFAPYAQSSKFGGKILRNNAAPKDIAFNIIELVRINNNILKLNPGIDIYISKN